jgi:hypothetical protein
MITGEYEAIRAASIEAMRDTCKIGVRGIASGDDPGAATYTYGAAIACGLYASTSGEIQDTGAQATITDAILRLPWGTAIATGDRIQIVTQAGQTLIAGTNYAVDGEPYQCLANIRVKLKKLTGASVL